MALTFYGNGKTVLPQVKVEVLRPVWINLEPRAIGWRGECNEYDAHYMQNIGRVKIIQSGKTS